MPTRSVNAGGAASGGAQGGMRPLGAYDADTVRDVAELRRVLAATELRCGAALRQLDRMRRQESVHKQEAEVLKEAVMQARCFAYHDELTGLPNRHLLHDHFKIAAALAARHDQNAALLFLDLDGFKQVNDTLGHSAGDKLLQQVAVRVAASIRASDTACRYGGDEFVVLLSDLAGKVEAIAVANDIRARLAAPYAIEGAKITITTSLGVAVYPADAHSYCDLLRVADRAMYRSKARHPAAPSIVDSPLDAAKKTHDVESLLGVA